jgi:hypothetical protein
MDTTSNTSIPRRNCLNLRTRTELAIDEAIAEVEQLAPDVRLTNAIVKLTEARTLVSDYIDGILATSTFKDRLIAESSELTDKIIKLEAFINSNNFINIEDIQQSLLKAQLFAMKTYSQILVDRIKFIEHADKPVNLMPEGFAAYICPNCKAINVKANSVDLTVGYCDQCEHPIWK